MPATYTFDVFSSLDGFGAHSGDWGGYWGKQGPELLARRQRLYEEPARMVFGGTTFREFAEIMATRVEGNEAWDAWVVRELPMNFDLELLESRTLDGNTQELIYRPTLHP
jgi:hypothetical protein